MNTIIIEHADQRVTSLFEQLSELMGLEVQIKPEPEQVVPKAITNPDILQSINDYETGRVLPLEISMISL